MASHTQTIEDITPGATTGWQEVDAGTAPASSVAEIIALNNADATPNTVAVRDTAEAVTKTLSLNEAEDGGNTATRFLINVDASGNVDLFRDSANVSYYLVGYWEGVTWTDQWVQHNVGSKEDDMWFELAAASLSLQTDRVHLITVAHADLGKEQRAGVRTTGSSIGRSRLIMEAEGGGVQCADWFVHTDAGDGNIEVWTDQYDDHTFYNQGYFDSAIEFTEKWGANNITGNDDTWKDLDISTDIDNNDGRVADLFLCNRHTDSEQLVGVRAKGTSGNRYFNLREAEGYGNSIVCMSVQTDGDGVIQCWNPSYVAWFPTYYVSGYFNVGAAGPTTYERTVLLDALLKKTGITKSVDLDVALQTAGITKSVDLDVVIQKIIQKSVDLDTVLKAVGEELSVDLDTLLKAVGVERTVLLDLLIKLRAQKSVDLDVVLQAIYERSVDLDLLIKAEEIQRTVDLDVLIKLRAQRTILLDLLTKALGVQLSVDLDVALQKLGIEKSVDIDVLFQALGITRTVDLDVALQKLAIARSVDLDLVLQARYERSFDLDTVLMKKGIPRTVLLDVLLQEAGVTTYERTVLLDLLIKILEVTRTVDLDVALKKLGVERTVLLDVLIKILGITRSVDLDVLLKLRAQRTVLMDLIIKSMGVTRSVDLDVVFKKIGITRTFILDVVLSEEAVEEVIRLPIEGVIPRRRRRRPRPKPIRGELIREIAVTIYEELTKSWPAVIRIWEINNFSAELLQVIYTMDSFELQAFDQTIYETENLEAEIIPFHAQHLLDEVDGLRTSLADAGVDKASLEGIVTKLEKAVKMYELRRELTAER